MALSWRSRGSLSLVPLSLSHGALMVGSWLVPLSLALGSRLVLVARVVALCSLSRGALVFVVGSRLSLGSLSARVVGSWLLSRSLALGSLMVGSWSARVALSAHAKHLPNL